MVFLKKKKTKALAYLLRLGRKGRKLGFFSLNLNPISIIIIIINKINK